MTEPPYNCPFIERLGRVEVQLVERVPEGFGRDFAKLQEKVDDIHTTLYRNGLLKRLRNVENRQNRMAGIASIFGIISAVLINLWQRG